jgi:hypothetical protein
VLNQQNIYGKNKYARMLAKISEMEANEPNIMNRDIAGAIASVEADIQGEMDATDPLLGTTDKPI